MQSKKDSRLAGLNFIDFESRIIFLLYKII